MSLLTQVVARLLLAPLLVLAVGILVKGYTDVGDGFAAGVLAALGVIMYAVAFGAAAAERLLSVGRAYRLALAGLALALAVAIAPMLGGEAVLTHSPPPGETPAKLGTLELITAVAFDVGICLLVLGTLAAAAGLFARSEPGAVR